MTSTPPPTMTAMLTASLDPYRVTIRESPGLAHEEQVVEVPIPAGSPELFFLQDAATGRTCPVQASRQAPGRGYLMLALEPGQALDLAPTASGTPPHGVTATEEDGCWRVENAALALELPAGSGAFPAAGLAPGPVRRFRTRGGPWRGRTFFDTGRAPLRWETELLEAGPLRAVLRYRAELAGGGSYALRVTVDASSDFARCDEEFSAGAADQIVWDLGGDDLPDALLLLDAGAGHAARPVHYHADQRHARLWCWTQFSQLHDLSDGFAVRFPGAGDVVGWVTLDGGSWTGNSLNHLEAWTRRWTPSDPATRRLPADAKMDSLPGPERIPARGGSVYSPRFTVEGWLRGGRRSFALLLSTRERIAPPGGEAPERPLEHFEPVPDRERYRLQQGRLRRLHVRHGLLPLQAQLGMTFSWPEEPPAEATPEREEALRISQVHYAATPADDPDRLRELDLYLEARVLGFWEGSGAAYSNVVVGRKIGPEMLRAEKLAREGKADAATRKRWRARFAFLACLNFSENFYPGAATMLPPGDPHSVEPTLAGMANQNFYTDAIGIFGYAAQAFPAHPDAAAWRARFQAGWERQLEYHVFPESGLWEESHTYYLHVIHTVLPLLLRRRADGAGDGFADPAFRKMAGSALAQLSPRDGAHHGLRHLVAFGDHGADAPTYRHLFAPLARAFAPHDAELAGRLAWAGEEMDGAPAPGVPSRPVPWISGPVQGLGFFFRDVDETGTQSLLALRSGTAWGHHHNDEGSLQFFARGRAVIADAALSQPQVRGERKAAASGHSRAAIEGADPLNHLWRHHRGWITACRAEGPLPYAVAGVPTYAALFPHVGPVTLRQALWEARIVVGLSPTAFLVADRLDPSRRHAVRFQVAGEGVALDGAAARAALGPACHLRIAPLFAAPVPRLSADAPVQEGQAGPTTLVEYAGIAAPWTLFAIGAFAGAGEGFSVAGDRKALRLGWGAGEAAVALDGDVLEVALPGDPSVRIDAAAAIATLRAPA